MYKYKWCVLDNFLTHSLCSEATVNTTRPPGNPGDWDVQGNPIKAPQIREAKTLLVCESVDVMLRSEATCHPLTVSA